MFPMHLMLQKKWENRANYPNAKVGNKATRGRISASS